MPTLFGISFKAKSEIAERALLCAGFFKDGPVSINPENLNYLNCWLKTIDSKPPIPWPSKKTGKFAYSLKILLIKVWASLVISL